MATNNTDLLNNVVPAPSLSTLGFIFDSSNKFDQLMAHVFASEAKQSYLYAGSITSLPDMIQKVDGRQQADMSQRLRQGFYNFFNRYYQDVGVDVQITRIDESSQAVDFKLTITVTEAMSQLQYGYLIQTAQKKLQQIVKLNNYGQ